LRVGNRKLCPARGQALHKTGGSVTRAARLLGFNSHQGLLALLNGRHHALNQARAPVRHRNRSIILAGSHKPKGASAVKSKKISILNIEDHKLVAGRLREMLVERGMEVTTRTNGASALAALKRRSARYDVIILDDGLPDIRGLDLACRIRKLPGRKRTPIIMLSGSDCEAAAWRVGKDAFLRKPQSVSDVPSTITRLLDDKYH
jgi:CheY-like chemotaxis protein